MSQMLVIRQRYMITKGGITSIDLVTETLGAAVTQARQDLDGGKE